MGTLYRIDFAAGKLVPVEPEEAGMKWVESGVAGIPPIPVPVGTVTEAAAGEPTGATAIPDLDEDAEVLRREAAAKRAESRAARVKFLGVAADLERKKESRDASALASARAGYDWLRTPGVDAGPGIRAALSATLLLPTSEHADAWLIGAWSGYWHGAPPDRVHPSRGSTWFVDLPAGGGRIKVRVEDPYDHRDGVKRIG